MLENFSLDEGGDATVDTGHDDAEDFLVKGKSSQIEFNQFSQRNLLIFVVNPQG